MPSASRPLLIAHRGESYDAPENTLAAICLAWERGARAVEIDVRCTADHELIVIHDPDTRRIRGPRRPVAQQTVEALRTIDAGNWKHRRWQGERIPLLAEVLASVPEHGRLFIEIKSGPETVPLLANLLKNTPSSALPQPLVMSFDEHVVAAASAALRHCEICLLLRARDYRTRNGITHVIDRAQALGCRSVDLEAHRRLTPAVIEALHRAGLAVYTWTVNRPATARRLAAAGIDGITTDRCAWLAMQLRR